MPIYSYHCRACGKEADILVDSFKDRNAQRCPYCNSRELTPQLTTFAVHTNAPTACGMKDQMPGCPSGGCGACKLG